MNIQFSTLMPFYGNKNPNIRYYAHTDKSKKELKYFSDNIYYFCIDRQRQYVEITGNLYHKEYKLLENLGKRKEQQENE